MNTLGSRDVLGIDTSLPFWYSFQAKVSELASEAAAPQRIVPPWAVTSSSDDHFTDTELGPTIDAKGAGPSAATVVRERASTANAPRKLVSLSETV